MGMTAAMVPGHDAWRQTVSEIGEMGSPSRLPFAILLCGVGLCLLVFASAIRDLARARDRSVLAAYRDPAQPEHLPSAGRLVGGDRAILRGGAAGTPVGGDLPDVSPGIPDRRATITIGHICNGLDRLGSSCNRPSRGLVGIWNVEVEEGRRGVPDATAITDHHHRIINPEFCGAFRVDFTHGTEDRLQEGDEASHIRRDDARRDRWPTSWLEVMHGDCHSLNGLASHMARFPDRDPPADHSAWAAFGKDGRRQVVKPC
jgi:hypothetical protein